MASGQDQAITFAKATEIAYGKVFERFRILAINAGVNVQSGKNLGSDGYAVDVSPRPNTVEAAVALRIERLPYKRRLQQNPTEKYIQVLLDSTETYKIDDDGVYRLFLSNVRIGYYQSVKGGSWETLFSLRYDFENAKEAHPIFHVQLEEGTRQESVFSDLPVITPLKDVHFGIRIPSANVIGPTALLQLAADHLPHPAFKELLGVIRQQNMFSNWNCDCSTLDSADSATKLLSSGWYGCK